MKRFVVEGTWSGYRSSQRRLCHVSVHTRRREDYEKLHSITFTDGTSLYIHVRDAENRERVRENRSYSGLIDECIHHGVTSVADLPKK